VGDAREPDTEKRGKGELLQDPHHHRRDLALIDKALREQWDIPPEVLSTVPARLQKLLNDNPKMAEREVVRITQTLNQLVRTNQQAIALAVSQKPDEVGYSPKELHKHEHVHLESAPETPQIKVELVDDWYGPPDAVPKSNGKAKSNGRKKRGGSNGKQ